MIDRKQFRGKLNSIWDQDEFKNRLLNDNPPKAIAEALTRFMINIINNMKRIEAKLVGHKLNFEEIDELGNRLSNVDWTSPQMYHIAQNSFQLISTDANYDSYGQRHEMETGSGKKNGGDWGVRTRARARGKWQWSVFFEKRLRKWFRPSLRAWVSRTSLTQPLSVDQ